MAQAFLPVFLSACPHALALALLSAPLTHAATLDASATGPSGAPSTSPSYALDVATTGESFLAASASSSDQALTASYVAQAGHPASFVLASESGHASLALVSASSGSPGAALGLRLYDSPGPITIQAPAGFEISLSATFGFAPSLTFSPTSDDLTLYLRVAPGTPAGTPAGVLAVANATGPLLGSSFAVSARVTGLSAVSDNILRPPGQILKIPIAGLLANDARSDDGSIAFRSVALASAAGVNLTRSGAFILYPAPASLTADDVFTYTVIDSYGATSTASVFVQVATPAPAPTATTLSLVSREGGGFTLRLLGVPGRRYTVQVSTDLVTWTELSTATADAHGLYVIEDPVTPPPGTGRFYRAVYNRP